MMPCISASGVKETEETRSGVSPRNAALTAERRKEHRQLEALYADGWYDSITGEMFG